jgi:hypothetical protein
MKKMLFAIALIAACPAFAQDKATLDTRALLAETVTTAKPRAEYLTGARDALPAFVRVLARYRQLTDPVVATPVASAPAASAPAAAVRKAVGINLTGLSWYSSRQAFANLLRGSYWNINWQGLADADLTPLGYPKTWQPGVEYKRMMGTPTGGWVAQTSVACSWAGSGKVGIAGGTERNVASGDHALTFDLAPWNGKVVNQWITVNGVDNADPLRNLECHDAKVSAVGDFSREIVDGSSKYQVIRFMDWNKTNDNPTRTAANRPDPRSLDNPGMALENQMALAKIAGADPWFNHSWNDDATYVQWAAKYAHDNLPAGRKIYVELSNEVWNWQFVQAHSNLDEATALKINPNNGYGAWQNYARRSLAMYKIWEAAFADRPKDLVRVLGTQYVYFEVTRQALSYPEVAAHVDAVAGAPYFAHDGTKPFTVDGARAAIDNAVTAFKGMCDTARAAAPKVRCITYEGGQHELVNAQMPMDQFTAVQRSQAMGDLYSEYLAKLSKEADLIVLFNDIGPIGTAGAWGQSEYGGQVGAPKQAAVDVFLEQ